MTLTKDKYYSLDKDGLAAWKADLDNADFNNFSGKFCTEYETTWTP